MCMWCERYGEGFERWYLNPANFARRLYKVRKEEIEAAGVGANPQAAAGMLGVGRDFLEAHEHGSHALFLSRRLPVYQETSDGCARFVPR